MKTKGLHQVIAENVRRLRTAKGWRQEDLADLARRVGLDWRQSTVAAIEAGRREISWGELMLLQFTLPAGQLLQLRNLKQHVDLVDLGGVKCDREVYVKLIRALFNVGKEGEVVLEKEIPHALFQRMPDSIESASYRKVDRKVAKTLNVKPEAVSRAAFDLWGHGLAEERDKRLRKAGPVAGKSERMRLAWMTRRMTDELRGRLQQKGTRSAQPTTIHPNGAHGGRDETRTR